jgi:hypothetical protein
MAVGDTTTGRSRNLILAAMIFAVAMTFIDAAIVALLGPRSGLQQEADAPDADAEGAVLA